MVHSSCSDGIQPDQAPWLMFMVYENTLFGYLTNAVGESTTGWYRSARVRRWNAQRKAVHALLPALAVVTKVRSCTTSATCVAGGAEFDLLAWLSSM